MKSKKKDLFGEHARIFFLGFLPIVLAFVLMGLAIHKVSTDDGTSFWIDFSGGNLESETKKVTKNENL